MIVFRNLSECTRKMRAQVATIHAELLSNSPLVLLGHDFMTDFYYRFLPLENLIQGRVAIVDDKVVGFIVSTADSSRFMSVGIKKYWFRLALILFLSVLKRPSSIFAILTVLRIMKNLDSEEAAGAEILSFAVLPEFLSRKFRQESGFNISESLFKQNVAELKKLGATQIRSVIDRDNLFARLFYQGLGWKLTKAEVPGWHIPSVEMSLSLEDNQQPVVVEPEY